MIKKFETEYKRLKKAGYGKVKRYAINKICDSVGILSKPYYLTIDITDRCNLKCPTCRKWIAKPAKQELTINMWKEIIIKLRKWLGGFGVVFSGGEPFLKKDILELVDFAAENGVESSICTNGYLINGKMVDRIISSRLHHLVVSINGISPEIHDRTRGVEGSWKRAMDAIDFLNKAKRKFQVGISTILTEPVYAELIALVEYARENVDWISFQCLEANTSFYTYGSGEDGISKRDRKWYKKDPFWFSDCDKWFELIDKLILLKKSGCLIGNPINQLEWMREYIKDPNNTRVIECKVGVKNFSIDPYGNVRLCNAMEPIGNILENNPDDIWRSPNACLQRTRIKNCKETCRLLTCNFS